MGLTFEQECEDLSLRDLMILFNNKKKELKTLDKIIQDRIKED